MNDVDSIYEKFGKNFCLCPFVATFYATNRTIYSVGNDSSTISTDVSAHVKNIAVPCSLIPQNSNYRVVDGNILNSINSPKWKKIRQDFVEGKFQQIKDCSICINHEKLTGTSARFGANQFFTEHIKADLITEVQKIINNDYQVDRIFSLDYFPSNYCNYSCVMCAGSASSTRLTYEIKVLSKKGKVVLKSVDPSFFDILKTVEIINFTGGETVLQPQVHEIIDYLIQQDLSKNITISLLTNASTYPEQLIEKFKKFKKVIYIVSIDGIHDVIEYQRRGSSWTTVETNGLQLLKNSDLSSVVNHVLSAINIFNFMDFADWLFENKIQFVAISAVHTVSHLSLAAVPPELRAICLERLIQGRKKYEQGNSLYHKKTLEAIDQAIDMINNSVYQEQLLPRFVDHIKNEDLVSKKRLAEVVPEWKKYFID